MLKILTTTKNPSNDSTKYYSLPVFSKSARKNSNLATNLATAGLFSAIAACGGGSSSGGGEKPTPPEELQVNALTPYSDSSDGYADSGDGQRLERYDSGYVDAFGSRPGNPADGMFTLEVPGEETIQGTASFNANASAPRDPFSQFKLWFDDGATFTINGAAFTTDLSGSQQIEVVKGYVRMGLSTHDLDGDGKMDLLLSDPNAYRVADSGGTEAGGAFGVAKVIWDYATYIKALTDDATFVTQGDNPSIDEGINQLVIKGAQLKYGRYRPVGDEGILGDDLGTSVRVIDIDGNSDSRALVLGASVKVFGSLYFVWDMDSYGGSNTTIDFQDFGSTDPGKKSAILEKAFLIRSYMTDGYSDTSNYSDASSVYYGALDAGEKSDLVIISPKIALNDSGRGTENGSAYVVWDFSDYAPGGSKYKQVANSTMYLGNDIKGQNYSTSEGIFAIHGPKGGNKWAGIGSEWAIKDFDGDGLKDILLIEKFILGKVTIHDSFIIWGGAMLDDEGNGRSAHLDLFSSTGTGSDLSVNGFAGTYTGTLDGTADDVSYAGLWFNKGSADDLSKFYYADLGSGADGASGIDGIKDAIAKTAITTGDNAGKYNWWTLGGKKNVLNDADTGVDGGASFGTVATTPKTAAELLEHGILATADYQGKYTKNQLNLQAGVGDRGRDKYIDIFETATVTGGDNDGKYKIWWGNSAGTFGVTNDALTDADAVYMSSTELLKVGIFITDDLKASYATGQLNAKVSIDGKASDDHADIFKKAAESGGDNDGKYEIWLGNEDGIFDDARYITESEFVNLGGALTEGMQKKYVKQDVNDDGYIDIILREADATGAYAGKHKAWLGTTSGTFAVDEDPEAYVTVGATSALVDSAANLQLVDIA